MRAVCIAYISDINKTRVNAEQFARETYPSNTGCYLCWGENLILSIKLGYTLVVRAWGIGNKTTEEQD